MHITTSKKVDLVGVSKNEDVVVLRPLTHYRVEYVRSDGEPDEVVGSYIDRLWMEEAERWSFESRQPLTDANADARPSVLRIGSEEMPEWVV